LKLESVNPTGSYKDRFAAAAISHMRARGQNVCVATSSGNTGAALAAYCAAASIACKIAIVETATRAKLMQMLAHGAQLFRVRGFGLDPQVTAATFESLLQFGETPASALQISAFKYSPLGMAGVQTIAYEISGQLSTVRHVFVPAGGGGLTLAVVRGFQQLAANGQLARSPAVHCVQPEGNDTMASALRAGQSQAQAVNCTTTITGLQVPSVIDGDEVIEACRKVGGTGHTVADAEVYAVQQQLAREEGVFCEPAGAVATAAAIAAAQRGEIDPQADVVCLVTGSGFKDLAAAERMASRVECPVISLEELRNEFAAAST
jgi:threonine synthase